MDFDSDDYEDLLDINKKEDILCCCSKDIIHNEHMKFMLMADENRKNEVLFNK